MSSTIAAYLHIVIASKLSHFHTLAQNAHWIDLALVYYEYLFRFDFEVSTVWKRKLTLYSVLLASIRWVTFTGASLPYTVDKVIMHKVIMHKIS